MGRLASASICSSRSFAGSRSHSRRVVLASSRGASSEFKLLAKERFFYDYGFDHANVPVWRHEIRFEAALVPDRERLPHCIGGVGSPPLEQTGSPQELSNLTELFTPQFVLHQLTELVDRGSNDAQLAEHMRHLRPWLTAERFSQRSANRHLQASLGGAE